MQRAGISRRSLFLDDDREDLDVHQRLVALVTLDLLDALDDVSALYHPPKDGVLVVEPRRRGACDEKLRAVGVRAGVGHRHRVRSIMAKAPVELVLKLMTPDGGASCAIAERVSRLNHEALDDAVEDDAIVVAVACVRHKVLHRLRALVWKQLEVDLAVGRIDADAARKGALLINLRERKVFAGGLLVEDIPTERHVTLGLGRFPRGEEEESGALEGAADECGVLLVGYLGPRPDLRGRE
mmetsp:Transcript_7364/g.22768  ORF Transcript_7364/g.22768 Transcript_7364/m.22768 type:complete len:240 (-) Transcript_7364:1190-1909(-)